MAPPLLAGLAGAPTAPARVLSYVGPLLRGRDGEGTAAPELRAHAARLAERLLAVISQSAGTGGVS